MDQQPTSPGARSRTFSFRSDKSGNSKTKGDLTESPKDKQRRDSIWKSTSKANPNAAINEVQPGVAAVLEQSTLQPLRDVQHKDVHGNPIVDPDLSNPTRPRLERPLDTIRSFERAIDNGYRRRTSYNRSDSGEQSNQHASRRSSYFGGYDSGPSPGRHSQMGGGGGGGYYGNQRADGYANGSNGPPRMRYGNRMQSDTAIYQNRPYPQHGYHQSQNTMNTDMTTGSDSTGPWASNTDPSSENSSIDRVTPANKPMPQDGYGPNGYGPNAYGNPAGGFSRPIPEEQGSGSYGGAPAVQPPYQQRRPIPLGNSGGASFRGNLPPAARAEPEKKKGWLSRRFSKKS